MLVNLAFELSFFRNIFIVHTDTEINGKAFQSFAENQNQTKDKQ